MEINYNSATALESFIKAEGLGMRKRYGQNFLINGDIRLRLSDALEAETGAAVWEIGPGLGAMTRLLIDRKLQVRAFEIDAGFIRILRALFADEAGFTLVEGDALKTWPLQPSAPYLLGNLPYNIAAPLIGGMIEKGLIFKRMIVTVQKELAQRMAARPGTEHYSSFSVLCNSVYSIQKIVNIHSSSFYPRPHVDSCGVKLELSADSRPYPPLFYPLVRGLFISRRKIIRNNLHDFLASLPVPNDAGEKPAHTAEICAHILAANKLNGTERAENLDTETFFRLAQTLENMR